ncbi:glycosyltransferase family 2 protein [Hymenobacter sp. BT770]|uniref:glycosyltransferase family 2 protein n=1 Tax=Hymenobacter sp. BT770 TaxID=2886942 RepID=UPI001D10276F|nr:glycosyltransferase family 2 protein [Hymenobacter sp. BT770]MCC3155070.1 glycosyltransferase family 2 protein [Hymenobacter sp. BT770]MDO3417014.1 glycosyltransferase family 2 protein [Hymenobacter sp. BT770]
MPISMHPTTSVLLSVVSPVYWADATVGELVKRLIAALEPISPQFEIVLVDDRSPDDSWVRIQEQTTRDPRVRGLRLSRNFGQHCAITAGLDHCRGEWVVVMDCDLQDRPEEIPALFAAAQRGYDLVLARRTNRQDSWGQKLLSKLFYRVLSYLTDTPQDSAVANFGIYHRKVIASVLTMRESFRYFPTMVRWVGFRAGYLDVMHVGRAVGSSSYGLSQRLHLGFDILLANSDKPLRLTVKLGLALSGGAFLFVPVTLMRYWVGQISQPGYTSLIISIWFFSGLLLSVLGMVGLYIGKTFEQVKQRPIYIVDESVAVTSNRSPSR